MWAGTVAKTLIMIDCIKKYFKKAIPRVLICISMTNNKKAVKMEPKSLTLWKTEDNIIKIARHCTFIPVRLASQKYVSIYGWHGVVTGGWATGCCLGLDSGLGVRCMWICIFVNTTKMQEKILTWSYIFFFKWEESKKRPTRSTAEISKYFCHWIYV